MKKFFLLSILACASSLPAATLLGVVNCSTVSVQKPNSAGVSNCAGFGNASVAGFENLSITMLAGLDITFSPFSPPGSAIYGTIDAPGTAWDGLGGTVVTNIDRPRRLTVGTWAGTINPVTSSAIGSTGHVGGVAISLADFQNLFQSAFNVSVSGLNYGGTASAINADFAFQVFGDPVQVIPEPASMALLGSSLLVLGLVSRRRQ